MGVSRIKYVNTCDIKHESVPESKSAYCRVCGCNSNEKTADMCRTTLSKALQPIGLAANRTMTNLKEGPIILSDFWQSRKFEVLNTRSRYTCLHELLMSSKLRQEIANGFCFQVNINVIFLFNLMDQPA